MQRILLPALVLGLVLSGAVALADGDIYVGGPWGTRIAILPYTITAPGSYYLASNLSYSGSGDGITVATGVNHVTLDLMGFTLNGSGSGGCGIYLNGSKNVEIRNGTVTGWTVGIKENDPSGRLHRIINVRSVGNGGGIDLDGRGHLVKGCELTATSTNKALNIAEQGTVNGCTVKGADSYGIYIGNGIISDNVVSSTGIHSSRTGISVFDPGSLIKSNKVSGCGVGIYSNSYYGYGLNVIGNTVDTASGTTGIRLADDYSNLLDQNTVTGAGTHYFPSSFSKAAVRNNY
jgi:hypothetical protein